jgi:cell division protein FtsB
MKWFICVLAALVLMLQYRIWLSPDGTREVLQLRDAVTTQAAENQRLVERNRQLGAEVRNLKQDIQALEERARSELGLISANETYYQVVPSAAPQAGTDTSPAALRAAAN